MIVARPATTVTVSLLELIRLGLAWAWTSVCVNTEVHGLGCAIFVHALNMQFCTLKPHSQADTRCGNLLRPLQRDNMVTGEESGRQAMTSVIQGRI